MTERNLVTPPTQRIVKFPDLGDIVLLPDGIEYPITRIECRGIVIGEWVEFKDEVFPLHDFLNCLVWDEALKVWSKRPNLEEEFAKAEAIARSWPGRPIEPKGTLRIHFEGQDWVRLAATVPPMNVNKE